MAYNLYILKKKILLVDSTYKWLRNKPRSGEAVESNISRCQAVMRGRIRQAASKYGLAGDAGGIYNEIVGLCDALWIINPRLA